MRSELRLSWGLTRRSLGVSAVPRHCVLCRESVVGFFPVCRKGSLRVRGEPSEWRLWDPLHSWEDTLPPPPPPLRALRQNAVGTTRRGLKALSLVHCLQVGSGFLATRFNCWSLRAEGRRHKGACFPQLMCNIVACCGKQRSVQTSGLD